MLICIHKYDYFRMQDGISELLQEIIDLKHQIILMKFNSETNEELRKN